MNDIKLQYIVEMMELIEDNPEILNEDYLKKIKPTILYDYFIQYCTGGKDPYVLQGLEGLMLTQNGVRKLDFLRERLYHKRINEKQIKIQQSQTFSNILIALFGGIVAVISFLNYLKINDYKLMEFIKSNHNFLKISYISLTFFSIMCISLTLIYILKNYQKTI